MKAVTLRIIKRLAKCREMEVCKIAELLPRHTGDHLDFYPLASLISQGYVDMWLVPSPDPFREKPLIEIATLLYMWVAGRGQEFEYRGMRSQGADFGTERVFATAKAYLFLDERYTKRVERIWAFSAGIVTALFATLIHSSFGK
jgi:hypothetical protein